MDTKSKGDIAEQATILQALKMGWGVSKPIGDRLPYDLIFDVFGELVKIQVKYAYLDQGSMNFVSDNRRTKTNRRIMLREKYETKDFDFAVLYVDPLCLFWVMPVEDFISYGSQIHLLVINKQREPRSSRFKNAWNLILERAAPQEIVVCESIKVGEACNVVIPSQA
jgi:hypothetical protein